eukprot:CAMPEP_0174262502 /NCGR_PEP_ID=MMETSP0439-20130205/13012_1 /TAXON_ID=0 /ORGANISM="Stereomyxa ramosa, Strain Chinc5" /LENGTH=265 /DNA_ID=CAMNT_0015347221 /DNA_START=64 /DNA_END=861 /DNA_ORIENTATION=+
MQAQDAALSVHMKVSYKGELRRFHFTVSDTRAAYEMLEVRLRELFSIGEDLKLKLFYTDDEGDLVTVSCAKELFYGVSLCEKSNCAFRVTIEEEGEKDFRQQSYARSRHWKQEAKWLRRTGRNESTTDHDGRHKLGRRFKCRLVQHVNYPPDCIVPLGTSFKKIWRLRNTGLTTWPYATEIRFVSLKNGDLMGASPVVEVPDAQLVNPGDEVDVAVQMQAPKQPGMYEGFWKLAAPDGKKFGQRLRVKIVVPSPEQEIADMFEES